jgi:hypothetical protein
MIQHHIPANLNVLSIRFARVKATSLFTEQPVTQDQSHCQELQLASGPHRLCRYVAAKGNSAEEVEGMHRAWCKSLQLQLALWTRVYSGCDEW